MIFTFDPYIELTWSVAGCELSPAKPVSAVHWEGLT